MQAKIVEIAERNKVLKEHLKNVQSELINTQQLVRRISTLPKRLDRRKK
jgi:hypothetical protein